MYITANARTEYKVITDRVQAKPSTTDVHTFCNQHNLSKAMRAQLLHLALHN